MTRRPRESARPPARGPVSRTRSSRPATTLSANQLDFVRLVVDHLTENGAMEANRLYESPFTDFAPQGPEEIFPPEDADELVAAIEAVRASAEPKDEAA